MPADAMEPLAYQNRFVRQLVQTMTDYEASDATPQVISGPDNMIILQVSLEEWIKLTSSVFTGADICYPDESDSVRWILFRAVEQPVDLCALIAECIATSEATQAAIRDFVTSDPEINQHISDIAIKITEAQIVGKIVEGDCDNSVVAGKVVAIVERMNARNVDFLEILEVGTNDEERVANIIQAIPGLSETPANEIIDLAQDFLEDFAENYNAAVTEDWLDEVENELYCLAKESEDCSLTYQQLFDYFQARVGSGLTVESVLHNVIQFVLNGDFPTDDLVASGLYAIQLGFILAGQEFNGMSVPKLGSLTRDAAPSTKWEDWDECGPPPTCQYDFITGDQGWSDFTGTGQPLAIYHPDEGWGKGGAVVAGSYIERIGIRHTETVISTVTVTFNYAITGVVDLYNYAVTAPRGTLTNVTAQTVWIVPVSTSPVSDGIAIDFRVTVFGTIPDDLRIVCVDVS